MKTPLRVDPLWIWAARDLIRRPFEALLLGITLAALIAVAGTVLLLTEALSRTAAELLREAPSLVVRRVEAGGWAPIPAAQSVGAAMAVPGVTKAAARVWGTVSGPGGPVTVVGVEGATRELPLDGKMVPAPGRGEALTGAGVTAGEDSALELYGRGSMRFQIVGRAGPQNSMAAHDLVLLHEEDARMLLSIPQGFASDLAVYVFHDEEEAAIVPDLAGAFPWPVRITTRTEAIGTYAAGYSRRGGITLILLIPALLALALITAATVRDRMGRGYEAGLLKALGWTTGDVVKFQMLRALLVGIPAATLGMAASALLVLRPGSTWVGRLLLGWEGNSPALHLSASGAILVLLEVAALVIVPFLLATLWPALRGAAADPFELLEGRQPGG